MSKILFRAHMRRPGRGGDVFAGGGCSAPVFPYGSGFAGRRDIESVQAHVLEQPQHGWVGEFRENGTHAVGQQRQGMHQQPGGSGGKQRVDGIGRGGCAPEQFRTADETGIFFRSPQKCLPFQPLNIAGIGAGQIARARRRASAAGRRAGRQQKTQAERGQQTGGKHG